MNKRQTSWEKSSSWYGKLVGESGHFYHQKLLFPEILQTMTFQPEDSVLDVGCGQGVLTSILPKGVSYLGMDLSKSLLQQAKKRGVKTLHHDATKPWPEDLGEFSHIFSLLALQNMEAPQLAIAQIVEHLQPEGMACIILNHPAFRIPRLSHWGEDAEKKLRYRRIDAYHREQKIPIVTHPSRSKTKSNTTWSFHFPLEFWINAIASSGGKIVRCKELYSPKKSEGKKARLENRAREEIPLFLALFLKKSA